jgi:hypothetical protein
MECYIHDKVKEAFRAEIRLVSCLDETAYPLKLHSDGNHYCLFHFPSSAKDKTAFEKFFRQKLENIEKQIDAINKLPLTDDEKEKAKLNFGYEFHCVWFPSRVNLSRYEFKALAVFNSANFSKGVDFSNAKFYNEVFFIEANFEKFTDFNNAFFFKKSNFSGSKFDGYTDFRIAFFADTVLFELAQFSDETNFRSTTFRREALFHRIKILENSKLSFIWTSFQLIARFDEAVIKGYLHFEAGEGDIDDGKGMNLEPPSREFEKRFTSVFEGKAEFHHIGVEKTDRIIFNKVRLRPSWFVNVDSRKFNFTDILWENSNAKHFELEEELLTLKERLFNEPHNYQLLKIASRQLAENSENSNRFEESSKFRQMAFECERLERKKRISKWWNELISCKNIFSKLPEKIKTLPFDLIHWVYRWTSYYGESWGRAILVLATFVFILFPLIYTQTNFQSCPKEKPITISVNEKSCVTGGLSFSEAIIHSLTTATLQNVEYRKPLTVWGELWIILEKIFAPLQLALLALAIRRKFMR